MKVPTGSRTCLTESLIPAGRRALPGITHLQPQHSPAFKTFQTFQDFPEPPDPPGSRTISMSGIAAAVQHRREKNQGIGTNSQAVKYLNQDYEALRQRCFESGRLFQDESFPALPSSLGFNELGPNSYKVRGVSWQRPTVSEIKNLHYPHGVWFRLTNTNQTSFFKKYNLSLSSTFY